MKLTLFLILLSANGVIFAQAPTDHLDQLRREHAKTTALISDLTRQINSGTKDRSQLRFLGDRIVGQITGNRMIIASYAMSTTRFGLQEEYNHVLGIMLESHLLTLAYGRLTGVPRKAPTSFEQNAAKSMIRSMLRQTLRKMIIQKLGSQGLADAMTAGGFEEAVAIADEKITTRILSNLDSNIGFLVRAGIAGGSLDTIARSATRLLTVRYVTSLVAKLTSNSLIIEFAAGPIIRWVGDTLRRVFRPRGNLEARTERSVGVLRDAARTLNELTGRSAMYNVRLALKQAHDAADSAKYLVGDISRAKRKDLEDIMYAVIEDLRSAIKLTNMRFLINSKMATLDLSKYMDQLSGYTAEIKDMQAKIVEKPRDPKSVETTASNGLEGFYEVLTGSGGRKSYRQRMTVSGSESKLNFDYTIKDRAGTLKWRWTGYVSLKDAQTGRYRTLRGNGINQMPNGPRVEKASISLEQGRDGVWRITRFTLAGNVNTLRKLSDSSR